MKRIIVFCFLLASIFMYGQFENTVITVSDAMVEVGDTFEIEVSTSEVLDEWDVIAFQFDLGFDETLLAYNSVALGDVPGPANLISNEYEPGTVRVAYANYMNFSGAGTLVTLTFTALSNGETPLDIFDFKYNSTFLEDENQLDGNVIVSVPNPYSDVIITVDSPEAGLEEAFDLAILTSEMTSEMGAISFQFELVYDTNMMTFTGGYALGDVPNPGNLIANESEPGLVAVAYANVMPITGEGSLCSLEFEPAGVEGEAVAGLNYFRYNSFNLLNLVDGIITFTGGAQEVEISKSIVPGWNWFSVNVTGEDMGINSVLASIGTSGANIKNQSQSAIYYAGAGWFGSLNTINNFSLYKLEANDTATWEYTGMPVDLAETTYNFNSGWNWISYAPQEPEAINYALGGLENGANIKNQSQSAIYYAGAGWFGSLNTMYPTAGYMLQMNESEQHNYPEPERIQLASQEETTNTLQAQSMTTQYRTPDWTVNPPDFEYNGFIWGVVEVDGVVVDDVTDWIGAFVGDECRGIAEQNFNNSVVDYTVPFGHIAFMPMVYSNVTGGETITFKYYDASEDVIYDVVNTLEWAADMTVGNGWDPYVFEVSTTAPPEPHFETVWTGDPLYPHNITVVTATINGSALEAGDEVAVFDVDGSGNEICVGVTIVEGAAPYVVSASWDSYLTPGVVDGYVIGHPVIYRIWDASAETELTEIEPTPIPPWDGLYAFQGNTQVELVAGGGNIPPVADAGEDQIVVEGELVQLDGSGSYDPDGEESREAPDWTINPPDYEYNGSIWGVVILDGEEVDVTTGILGCFVGEECRGIATAANGSVIDYTVPFGHIIFLPMVYSNVTSGETLTFKYWDANTENIYDVEETIDWVADMVVGDGFNPFEFTVNTMPTSDLEFLWSAPAEVILSDPTSIMPTFTAPEVTETTEFIISLEVSDGESWSEPDEVVITVENGNIPPVADAGEDQLVTAGDLVQLDGTGSYDPDAVEEREAPDWTINPPDYEYNGSIWGVVILDGVEVNVTTGILGCFVGEECRGIATAENGSVIDYTVPFGHIIFLPMVYSNVTSGETLTFKYWDAASDGIYDVEETIEWQADMVVGDGFNPFEFTVNTIFIPNLEFAWTSPEEIILSDPTSAIPTFIAPEVDEETPYIFSLVVSDGEAWSEPDEVMITVQSGNAAPEIVLPDFFEFEEDMSLTLDFAVEGYISDPDLDPLSLIVEGNEMIIVGIEGMEVTFSAPENWYGSETLTFTVDDQVERLTASDDVEVIVNPVNDAPVFIYEEPVIEFNEDESIAVDFAEYISDVDGDELTMYVTEVEEVLYEIDGFVVEFSAPENWNGTDAVIIGVTDNQGRDVAEVNVDIIVLPVNDAPTIELPEMAEIEEDTTWEFDVSPYVDDVDGDDLEISNISIYSGEPGWEFGVEGLMVYITPPADFYDIVDIGLTVTDNVARETAEDMMVLNILPVNDAPYLVMELPDLELMEDFEPVLTDLSEYFDDVDGDELTYGAEYNDDEVTISISDNMMYIESEENWVGTASVTVTADDGQERLIVSDTFEILVIGVNDPPYVYNEIPDMELEEDFEPVTLILSDYFTDPDGDLYNYWAEYNEEAVLIEIMNGELTIASVENWNGELDITVYVDDNMRVQADDTFHLTVLPVNDAPEIELPELFSFNEDEMLEEDFSAYIEDVDGDDLLLEASENIYINVEIDGLVVSFSAEENWNGIEEISFAVYDEFERLMAEDVVTVEVVSVNDAPVAVAGGPYSAQANAQEIAEIQLDGSGSYDIDGEIVSWEWSWEGGSGSGEMLLAEFPIGETVVSLTVTDNEDGTGEDFTTVTVTEYGNIAPIAMDDNYEGDEDTEIMGNVLDNDEDPDEYPEALTVELLTDVMNGMLELMADGSFSYMPAENWNGEDMFTYRAFDGMAYSAEAEVILTVMAVNDPPELVMELGDVYLEEDFESYLINLEGYFTDIDDEVLSYAVEYDPAEIMMTEQRGGLYEITSVLNWNGESLVGVTVSDGEYEIVTDFTVYVEPVNDAPTIELPEMFSFEEDGMLEEDFAAYVDDIDGDVLLLNAEGNENIIVEIADLTVTFTAMENWNGSEEITFMVYDEFERLMAEDMVTVEVLPVNDAPTIELPEMFSFEEDGMLEEDFSAYVDDIDGDELTLTVAGNEAIMIEITGLMVYFSAEENWNGEELLTFTIDDGMQRVSASEEVNVIVTSVNDNPVAEANGPYYGQADEEGNAVILLDGSGSYDIDGEIAAWNWTWEGGQASGETVEAIFPTGDFEVELTVTDDEGGFALDTAIVTVSGYENIPPVAEADSFEGEEDTGLYGNVLYNDMDPDEYPEALTAELVNDVANGVLEFYADGEFEYMPNENWYGLDSFEYQAFDGLDYSEQVVVELSVLPVNDAPVLVEELEDLYLEEDFGQYQLDIAGNFIDVDEEELTYNIGFAAEDILVVNLGGGSFLLESVENWNGETLLEVTASDGEYIAATSFMVYVEPVNDEPALDLPESFTMDEGEFFEVDFSEYASDTDEDELELTVSGNENIVVMIDGLMVTFDSPMWYGEELMTFTVNDNVGRAVASDDVLVIVRPALFEAIITVGSANVFEDEAFEISVSTSEIYDYWNVISFEFDLQYDSELYEYVGYSAGEVPNANGMLIVNNSAPGTVAVAYADAMAMTGAGDLVTFEFMAVNAGVSEANIEDFRYNSTMIGNVEPGIIQVIDVNHPPVADAGADQSGYEFEVIMLDGTGSYDPDEQDLDYLWTAPAGIELDDPASATPSFTAPEVTEDTDYIITLTVSDGEFEDSDEVMITVLNFNHAPVADAGEDQIVEEGDIVQLDGSMSFDEDNDAITYLWEAPAGIFLDNAEEPYPTFIAPAVNEDTDFEIVLTVSDGEYTDSDEVIITVLNAEIPDIEAEITITSGVGEPGEPVGIEVLTTYLDPSWNIFSYEFNLAFDELELSLDGWSLDGTIVNPDGILEVEFLRGVVNFKFVSQVSTGGREFIPIEGEGSLINLEFTSLTGGQASFDIYDFTFNTEEIEVVLPGVINNNAPYVAVPIPEQILFEDFETVMLDLNTFISDLDEDMLSYTVESGEGIITEMNENILEISSVENYNGEEVVTVTAWDGYSDLSVVTTEFNVIVTPVNDAPEIDLPAEISFEEDGELEVDFAPYISDVDGDALVLAAEENENIIVEIAGFMVTLSALPNYYGTELIGFTVDDGMNRATATDEVAIVVTSVNDLPVAEAGAPINATAGPAGTAMVTLDGSASYDIDGEIVEYHWGWNGGEAYGETAEVELAAGNYTVTLTVTDDESGTDQDNVQVSVAPFGGTDPIAYPDAYMVDEDMVLTVEAVEGILANDVDDGYPEPLTAIMIEEPAVGSLIYAEEAWDGSFEYTPPANWYGEVIFEYVAYDGNLFSEVTEVTITVNSVNDLPTAEAGGPYFGDANVTGTAIITLAGSATDIDGEIVLYEWYYNDEMIGNAAFIDYEFEVGVHEVYLVVTDDEGGIGEDSAEVTIAEYENIAPIAEDDYYTVNEDEILTVDAASGVLANDYDPDQYPEMLSSVLIDQREFILNSDGSFEFIPEADFNGTVSYEYYATDGEAVSETAMIYIEVLPVNDAPEIELPEDFTFAEDEMLEVDFAEYITDIDSEYLTLTVSGNVMVSVEIEEFIVNFGAEADWYGEEELTFTISDNEARLSDSDNIIIVVTPVNDAPVINEYLPAETEITIYDDTIIEFYLAASDVDSDLEYTWTLNDETMPIIGHIFTPEFTAVGDYEITVEVSDGEFTESLMWIVHYVNAPDWQVVTYDNLTTAYGYVTVDGLTADEGDMIGAFVDGECRGMGTVDGTSRVNFNIFGDIVEVVNFKFWDEATDTIYDIEYFTQTYPGGQIGSIGNPLPLAVDTGVGPGWVPVIYTNSTIVYAIVTIEGEEAEEGDLVAAFVGDECRSVTEVQIMNRNAIASMVVQGEEVETVHFRIWDSSEDIIYNVATTIQSNPGGVVGYPPNEILLDGSNATDITQTLNLSGGWNLISLYVRATDMSVESIFAPIMDNIMKVKDIYSSYDPNLPPVYNTLSELEDGSGYYVKVTGVSTLEITGIALDPAQTPLELNSGWNLVAYVNQTAMSVEDAFAELIENETLHKVKDIFSSYDPNLPPAYNTLVNMEPGKGYYLRVTESMTFYYPAATRTQLVEEDRLADSIWRPVVYTNSMVTYVQIAVEGSAGMIVGGFSGEECRGIARVRSYNGVNIASLVINSEEPEEISFKIFDPVSGEEYYCNETVTTVPGEDCSGMPVLTVKHDGEDVALVTGIKGIYPNPFNPETSISFHLQKTEQVSVKVYNVRGQLVTTLLHAELESGEHILSWNGNNESNIGCTSGVYFVRFTAGSVYDVQKVILMK